MFCIGHTTNECLGRCTPQSRTSFPSLSFRLFPPSLPSARRPPIATHQTPSRTRRHSQSHGLFECRALPDFRSELCFSDSALGGAAVLLTDIHLSRLSAVSQGLALFSDVLLSGIVLRGPSGCAKHMRRRNSQQRISAALSEPTQRSPNTHNRQDWAPSGLLPRGLASKACGCCLKLSFAGRKEMTRPYPSP